MAARTVMGVSSGSSTREKAVNTPIPGPMAACAMSTGPAPPARICRSAAGSSARSRARNSRRVAAPASGARLRQTRTMDDARAFAPMPTERAARSVLTGHVPSMT